MGKENFVTLFGPHISGSATFCYAGRLKQVNSQYKSKILYRAVKEDSWAEPSFHYPTPSMPPVPADTTGILEPELAQCLQESKYINHIG